MNLPIRWAVVRETGTGFPAIMAKLVHGGTLYEKTVVVPTGAAPALVKLMIAAMAAEISNAVS